MRKRHGLQPWSLAAISFRVIVPSALAIGFVLALNSYAGIPVPVLIFVVVALAGAFVTENTLFGRYLYAIGGNPEAARFSGINLRAQVLVAFCLLGFLTAIAGIIYTARLGSAGPDAGTLLELDAIAACVIGGASLAGGRGTVLGACLGALFMVSLDNGMSLKNVPDFVQDIIKGGILVTAVGLDVIGKRRE
jgi:D-xylose transport system permease protein